MIYKDYLKTNHWKTIRKEFWERSQKRCFLCHKKNDLHLHHKRYRRYEKFGDPKGYSILFKERHQDFRLLCKDCHRKIHKYQLEEILAKGKVKRKVLRNWIKKL